MKVSKKDKKTEFSDQPRPLQQEDFDAWKKNHGYGYRWIAESAFSAFKRTFGER